MVTLERHAVPDHARLDVVVEDQRHQRILDGTHHQYVIREGVGLFAVLSQFLLQPLLLLIIDLLHEERLEIVLARLLLILGINHRGRSFPTWRAGRCGRRR